MTCSLLAIAVLCTSILVVFGQTEPIVFVSEPAATIRSEGQTVPCFCEYNGTETLPFWMINDVIYSPAHLPPNYINNSTGIFFTAERELNQSTYQCLFIQYNTTTRSFQEKRSQIGRVFVERDESYVPEVPVHSCGSIGPVFTGISVDNENIEIYWNVSNCLSSTTFCINTICENDTTEPKCTTDASITFNRNTFLSGELVFSLTVRDNTYKPENIQLNSEITTGIISAVIDGSLPIRIPINLLSCNGGGTMCIHSDPSRSHSSGTCYPISENFCDDGYLPAEYKCNSTSDSALYVFVVSISEGMNNTLYTYMCPKPCTCNQSESCSVVDEDYTFQLTFLEPPLQPGKPCLYLNGTHAIVCVNLPFSHLNITHFVIEVNYSACNCSYEYTINSEDLCTSYELQSSCNCSVTEFTITAYSSAGASPPSPSVLAHEGEQRSFCRCIPEFVPLCMQMPDDNALELGLGIGIGILALVCVMVLCVILCCVCWPRKKGEYGPKKEEKRDAKKKENEGKSRTTCM